jgi:sulfur carrier protein
MQVIVNGEATELNDGATAADLIEQLGLGGQRVAMEVNRDIVSRSTYADHPLAAGDEIEIVRAIGGGSV